METRDIKELLILLRENINRISYTDRPYGICGLALILEKEGEIKEHETIKVDFYLHENIPSTERTNEGYVYWWPEGEIPPRLKWLNEQIEKL